MEWIRDNMKVIVFAMALPFLLVLLGVSFF
jgi:hypothetical protein